MRNLLLFPVVLAFLSVYCSAANLLIVNPGAETGTLDGWTPIGISGPPKPEINATVNIDPIASSEGNNSFLLWDQSTEQRVGIRYSSRIEFDQNATYIFSFDARVDFGENVPWVNIGTWTAADGGQYIAGRGISFGTTSSFNRIFPTLNGFLHYEILLRPPSSPPGSPLPSPLFYEFTFYNGFYDHLQGAVLIDNVSLEVPEPSAVSFCIVGLFGICFDRRRHAKQRK